jgi:hypothetical protein
MKSTPTYCCRLILLMIAFGVPLTSGAVKKGTKKQDKPLPAPSLPAGTTFDPNAPQVTLPDKTFTIPQELSVMGTAEEPISPTDLNFADWLVIAKSTNMLRGSLMDEAAPDSPDDSVGRAPVRYWKVPEDDSFVTPAKTSTAQSYVSYSESASSFVSCGYDEQSASASFPFAAGSFNRAHQEKHARSLASRNLYMTGVWYYPVATIDLSQCTVVSPVFERCVEDALDGHGFSLDLGPNGPEPARDVAAVFDYFGHAVPTRVTIGAQLNFGYTVDAEAKAKEDAVSDTVKAAVTLKVGGVGGDAAFQSAKNQQMTAKKLAEITTFRAIGGDRTLVSDPKSWAPTTKNWRSWAIIRRTGMRSTVELLKPAVRKRVLDLWPKISPMVDPAELEWKEHSGSTVSTEASASGFIIARRQSLSDGDLGSVSVRSGVDQVLAVDGKNVASGTAYVTAGQNIGYRGSNSVCIPVRQGGHYSWSFEASHGSPKGRLLYVTNFFKLKDWISLGKSPLSAKESDWIPLKSPPADGWTDHDGFLFVNVKANETQSPAVLVRVDKNVVGGASAQGARIREESLCIPLAAGVKIDWQVNRTHEESNVRAYWMPFQEGNVLRIGQLEDRVVEQQYEAESAGFVHGYLEAREGFAAGSLEVHVYRIGEDQEPVCVATSVHNFPAIMGGTPNLLPYNSFCFPVAKGAYYKVNFHKSTLPLQPTPHIYWTPVQ